jgi:hypothetical protein
MLRYVCKGIKNMVMHQHFTEIYCFFSPVATDLGAIFAFCRKLPIVSQPIEEKLEKIFGIFPESLYLCNVERSSTNKI